MPSPHVRAFEQHRPRLGARVYVDPTAVIIGEVEIGEDCSFWPGAVVRGDMQRIVIGARTSIQDGAVCHVTHAGPYNPEGHPLLIGEDVTVGHKALLHGCRIGSRVLVGMGAIVMDGAVVPDEVIVGAGALIPAGRVLESGFLYVGAPARKIRALTEEEKAFFRYSAQNYLRLKDRYLAAS
ncbi:MAG: gamma carbonic anhydrase family protein [Gammaproteobacteria bacterium]|nr:gamma carbonic anhydrase family protein [Gammaproteobacteria bacterium]